MKIRVHPWPKVAHYLFLIFITMGRCPEFIRSTTKHTKVHEGNLWIYLIEIFVLSACRPWRVSFVVNIESSWNLRGLDTGQWATLKMTIERQATD